MHRRLFPNLIILLLLFSTASADTVYDIGHGYWLSLPNASMSSSGWYTYDGVKFTITTIDLTESGLSQEQIDKKISQFENGGLYEFCVALYKDVRNYQDESILSGIPCSSFDILQQNAECKCALMINGTNICLVLMTDAHTSKIPDDNSYRNILNAFSITQPDIYDSFASESIPQNHLTNDGYYLSRGPLLINLTEQDYNIVYQNMPNDCLSVQRSGYKYGQIDTYLKAGEGTDMIIWRLNENGLVGHDASIHIRIKDKKYDSSYDARWMSRYELEELGVYFANGLSKTGEYNIKTVNGIPYIIFQTNSRVMEEIRGATIIHGSFVYVFINRDTPLTLEDEEFFNTVLESISIVD